MHRYVPPSFGWRPDLPDFRDFAPETSDVADSLKALPPASARRGAKGVDLRKFFPDCYDQGPVPSSPAQACAALLAYFEQRAKGFDLRPARMFLHYTAQRMAAMPDACAVTLRDTLKAVVRCGVPPERFWPYKPEQPTKEPDAFLYSFCGLVSGLQYVRLDSRNRDGGEALAIVKSFLAAGFPSVFGLSVPSSINSEAEIPYRPTFDSLLGGQAMVAVGFNDQWLGATRGALLVRNSWGAHWGESGYGWLPYAFVEAQLAQDFWTLLRPEWLASGEFVCPSVVARAK
jgi:C1A family cysteine protease